METRVSDPAVVDSALIRRLEQAICAYGAKAIEELTRPSPLLRLFTKRRYMEWSKPRPHEFGPADARSVLRRVRKGRPVSNALLSRAVKALVDEAGYYSED